MDSTPTPLTPAEIERKIAEYDRYAAEAYHAGDRARAGRWDERQAGLRDLLAVVKERDTLAARADAAERERDEARADYSECLALIDAHVFSSNRQAAQLAAAEAVIQAIDTFCDLKDVAWMNHDYSRGYSDMAEQVRGIIVEATAKAGIAPDVSTPATGEGSATMDTKRPCSYCGGTGVVDLMTHESRCPHCKGKAVEPDNTTTDSGTVTGEGGEI